MIGRYSVFLVLGAVLNGCASMAGVSTSPQLDCVLSVEETPGTLAIVDVHGSVTARIPLGERPHEVAVSQDGKTAYVSQFGIADYDNRIGTPGDRVIEIDLARARRTAEFVLPLPSRGPHGVKLRPGTNELFVNAEVGGDKMFAFNKRSHRVLRSFSLPKGTHNFVFSSDGASLFSFAGSDGASRIDPEDGRILAHQNPGSAIRGLFFTQTGTVLASAKGEILELRPDDLSIIRRLRAPRPGQFVYLEQWPNGMIVAPSLGDGGVAIFPADGRPARFVVTGKAPIFARRGPDGLIYVTNVEDDHISILSRDGEPLRTISDLVTPNGLGFGRCPSKLGLAK